MSVKCSKCNNEIMQKSAASDLKGGLLCNKCEEIDYTSGVYSSSFEDLVEKINKLDN